MVVRGCTERVGGPAGTVPDLHLRVGGPYRDGLRGDGAAGLVGQFENQLRRHVRGRQRAGGAGRRVAAARLPDPPDQFPPAGQQPGDLPDIAGRLGRLEQELRCLAVRPIEPHRPDQLHLPLVDGVHARRHPGRRRIRRRCGSSAAAGTPRRRSRRSDPGGSTASPAAPPRRRVPRRAARPPAPARGHGRTPKPILRRPHRAGRRRPAAGPPRPTKPAGIRPPRGR